MLQYKFIYPLNTPDIYGDNMKEAVKNYIKFSNNQSIRNIIIKDQNEHQFEAKMRYYMDNEKNKVGIDIYPYPNSPNVIIGNPLVNLSNPLVNLSNPFINQYNSMLSPSSNLSNNPFISPINPLSESSINPLQYNPVVAVTTKDSSYMATANNVYINRPY